MIEIVSPSKRKMDYVRKLALYHEEVLAEERQASRAEGHEEGRAEGLAEGESRFAELTERLLSAGRMHELRRALADSDYREELYRQN